MGYMGRGMRPRPDFSKAEYLDNEGNKLPPPKIVDTQCEDACKVLDSPSLLKSKSPLEYDSVGLQFCLSCNGLNSLVAVGKGTTYQPGDKAKVITVVGHSNEEDTKNTWLELSSER